LIRIKNNKYLRSVEERKANGGESDGKEQINERDFGDGT
jgi:hypothetical protein